MTSTGSISLSGLLGGTAGQIDTTSLINSLMTAAALPQTQLQDQLSSVENVVSAYQSVNTKLSALQSAAQAVTDPTLWTSTTASSSTTSVVATSTGAAAIGSTTFSVTALASTQVSSVAVDSFGNVVSDPSAGFTITVGGVDHQLSSLASGQPADVAKAINAANFGVRASVVNTDQGQVLQLTSAKSGVANALTLSNDFTTTPQTVTAAQDAQVTVGNPNAGGYTVSSSSNTFTSLIPGVTFSVSALQSNVSITITNDSQSISDKIAALAKAANAAVTEVNNDSGQGAILQGRSDVRTIAIGIASAVSSGTAAGGSLKTYGIDMDSTGQLSFDADAFAAAYAADPAGTQAAVSGAFATHLDSAATAAVDPVSGSVTQELTSLNTQEKNLNSSIDDWTTRLGQIKDNLTTKYTAMETALAKLQSQQTYLTSMFASINKSSDSSSSS
jgi:flagellar hook-associated protein 2